MLAFTLTLNEWRQLRGAYPDSDELLKRFALAVVALYQISAEDLDGAFELHLSFAQLPTEGKTEMIAAASEVHDLYSYLESQPIALPQSRSVDAEFTGRFERPDFPLMPDDN